MFWVLILPLFFITAGAMHERDAISNWVNEQPIVYDMSESEEMDNNRGR